MSDPLRHDVSPAPPGTARPAPAAVAVRFRVGGLLRFLSHAETQRVFERACVRAAVPVRYTEGFNPHARLSLPLPRPVGVESDDELLVVRLTGDGARELANRPEGEAALQQALAEQVPDGITVHAVTRVASNASFHPQAARYVLPLRPTGAAGWSERLRDRIARVMAESTCVVERQVPGERTARRIDVRPFLHAVRLEGTDLLVQYEIRPSGSIRVEEILSLFGLRTEDLAGPIRRTDVTWEA